MFCGQALHIGEVFDGAIGALRDDLLDEFRGQAGEHEQVFRARPIEFQANALEIAQQIVERFGLALGVDNGHLGKEYRGDARGEHHVPRDYADVKNPF